MPAKIPAGKPSKITAGKPSKVTAGKPSKVTAGKPAAGFVLDFVVAADPDRTNGD